MTKRSLPHRRAKLACAFAGLVVLVSVGLFSASALVPAPPAVLPLVALVCIGGPMVAVWELRSMIGRSSATPLDSHALTTLRRHLDQLPETQHPLGL